MYSVCAAFFFCDIVSMLEFPHRCEMIMFLSVGSLGGGNGSSSNQNTCVELLKYLSFKLETGY